MIITRYLGRQVLLTTAAVTVILLVVAVLGRLLQYLAQASQGELDPAVLLLLMSYRVPDFLQLILPLALLLGILLSYGRMYAESEMTVLIACGLSRLRLLTITLVSTAGVMLVVGVLALYLTPRGLVNTATLLEAQKDLNEFDVMVPGLFQNISRGQRTTYAETITANNLNKVFVHEAARNRVIFAELATPIEDENGRRSILFRNGTLTEGQPGSADFAMTSFAEMGVELPQRELAFDVTLQEKAMSNAELLAAGEPAHLAELQWRISLVLLMPVLALLAVPLSRVSAREGRFARLIPAILLYIAYFGLLLICRDLLAAGSLPAWLGLWWVHGVFALLGWLLLTERLGGISGFRFLGQHV